MTGSTSSPGAATTAHRTAPRRRRPVPRWAGAVGAVAATGMAALWTVVVPEQAATAQGWQQPALRWGHAACWALLALAAASHALGGPRRLTSGAAWAGLVAYALFLAALFL